jgi:hypothetical protein
MINAHRFLHSLGLDQLSAGELGISHDLCRSLVSVGHVPGILFIIFMQGMQDIPSISL